METSSKTLILAILIILLGVVTFNFNTISGRQTQQNVDISVYPKVITFTWTPNGYVNEPVTVTVNAQGGVNRDFFLYREGEEYEDRQGGYIGNLCTKNICVGENKETLYLNGELEDGTYFFKFKRKDQEYNSERIHIRHNR